MSEIDFRVVESASQNPYLNLAAETVLTDSAADTCYFYLWQNAPTVVIGYNQNPFSECALEIMRQDGVFLARRRTGGGAVFHDYGNLNFSFVMPDELYDVKRQSKVIIDALKDFGINAELSGRNDILADGKKFSGNAFYKGKTHKLHHGTIMLSVDFTKLAGYLTPDPSKYLKKGVSSVRSRVVNLSELNPDITIETLKKSLFAAFIKEYDCGNCEAVKINSDEFFAENTEIKALAEKISSDEYLYKKWRDFSCDVTDNFSWGQVKACISGENGKVEKTTFSTDGLFPSAVEAAEKYIAEKCADENSDKNEKSAEDFYTASFSDEEKTVFYDLINLAARKITNNL